jgi:hypothetical protein
MQSLAIVALEYDSGFLVFGKIDAPNRQALILVKASPSPYKARVGV